MLHRHQLQRDVLHEHAHGHVLLGARVAAHRAHLTLLDVLANPLGTMGYLSIIGILERQAKDERGNVDADAGFNGVPNNVATVTNLRLGDTVATPRGNLKRVDCRLLDRKSVV